MFLLFQYGLEYRSIWWCSTGDLNVLFGRFHFENGHSFKIEHKKKRQSINRMSLFVVPEAGLEPAQP